MSFAEKLPWVLLAVFLVAVAIAYNEVSYELYRQRGADASSAAYVAAFDRFLDGGDSLELNRRNCETARSLLEQQSRSFRFVCRQRRWF